MDEIEARLLDFFRGVQASAAVVEAPLSDDPLARWLVDFAALFDGEHEDEQWLLEPLLAKGRAHALYAGAKVGKSYVMLYLAAALATGRAVLRRPAGEPVHVLYVDYEMTSADLLARLEEFGYGPDDAKALDGHLHYALLPSIPALDTEEGGELFARSVTATGAEVVVIDTTMRSVLGEENSADTINAFYRCTGLRLKALGVTWVRLDHAGKDIAKGQRGTSAKDGDVDLVLRMERVEGGLTIRATHTRVSWYPALTAYTVTDDPWPTRITVTDDEVRLWADGTKEVANLLDELEVPVEASVRAAAKALREAGHQVRQKTVADAVRWRKDPHRTLTQSGVTLLESHVSLGNRVTANDTPPDLRVTPPVTPGNGRLGEWVTPRVVRHGVTPPHPDGPETVPEEPREDLEESPW